MADETRGTCVAGLSLQQRYHLLIPLDRGCARCPPIGGVAIGWGIQFQQPVFLVAMTLIVALFASNLFGFFEIVLPSALSDVAGSAGNGHSLGGHFLTGAFATLLATPCSAPFLGTAVGFALSRGPAEIFGIFFVLGLGLSLPYLCVAAAPQFATRLPRPGNWMIWLRHILGLALAATGVWLITVLTAQIGAETAISIAALILLMVAVIALKQMPGSRLGRHAGKVTTALAVAALLPAPSRRQQKRPLLLLQPPGALRQRRTATARCIGQNRLR